MDKWAVYEVLKGNGRYKDLLQECDKQTLIDGILEYVERKEDQQCAY